MNDQASRLREMLGGSEIRVSGKGFPETTSTDLDVSGTSLPKHRGGHVIAVTSGKGGVGKTTVAVNLALLLAQQGLRTLLVDADLGLANVDVMLGIETARHAGHLLLQSGTPEDVAVEGPCGLAVISGGSGLRELADAGSSERAVLLGKLRDFYKCFDCAVVDTSPGIGAEVADFLVDAGRILLVTSAEPTSVRDTYAATKSILSRTNVAPELLVNMATAKTAAEVANTLNRVTGRFLDYQCDKSHFVVSDPMVGRAIAERRPLAVTYPRSPAVVSLRSIADTFRDFRYGQSLTQRQTAAVSAPSVSVAKEGSSVLALETA